MRLRDTAFESPARAGAVVMCGDEFGYVLFAGEGFDQIGEDDLGRVVASADVSQIHAGEAFPVEFQQGARGVDIREVAVRSHDAFFPPLSVQFHSGAKSHL